jgi:hypothetical protein
LAPDVNYRPIQRRDMIEFGQRLNFLNRFTGPFDVHTSRIVFLLYVSSTCLLRPLMTQSLPRRDHTNRLRAG